MVTIIVDWIGVHVANAEDVDEHTEEGCDKEKHHRDVIDVNTNAEDLLVDGHSICTHPSEREPITNVMRPCSLSNEFGDEEHGENKACDHDWKSDEPTFLGRLDPCLIPIEDVPQKENDWESKHW